MKIDLTGKTALVTGSTSGIGHAIARGLAGAGAEVVVNGRTQAKVDAAAAAIAKAVPGAKVRGIAADVSTAGACLTASWTSSEISPWHVIPANFKWYARLKTVKTVVDRLEKAGIK